MQKESHSFLSDLALGVGRWIVYAAAWPSTGKNPTCVSRFTLDLSWIRHLECEPCLPHSEADCAARNAAQTMHGACSFSVCFEADTIHLPVSPVQVTRLETNKKAP